MVRLVLEPVKARQEPELARDWVRVLEVRRWCRLAYYFFGFISVKVCGVSGSVLIRQMNLQNRRLYVYPLS